MWVIVALSIIYLITESQSQNVAGCQRTQQEPNLTLNLYYETLCPDCQIFSKEQLCPAFRKMGQYFRIDFVPFGNARSNMSQTGEITITCQHGPDECKGNRLHSCALNLLPYDKGVKFICCMESAPSFQRAGPLCAKKVGVSYPKLKACADSDTGNHLHYLNGVQTSKLQPPHEWVPWILFNNTYNKEDMEQAQEDVISVLCKYLNPKPSQCNEIS